MPTGFVTSKYAGPDAAPTTTATLALNTLKSGLVIAMAHPVFRGGQVSRRSTSDWRSAFPRLRVLWTN